MQLGNKIQLKAMQISCKMCILSSLIINIENLSKVYRTKKSLRKVIDLVNTTEIC